MKWTSRNPAHPGAESGPAGVWNMSWACAAATPGHNNIARKNPNRFTLHPRLGAEG